MRKVMLIILLSLILGGCHMKPLDTPKTIETAEPIVSQVPEPTISETPESTGAPAPLPTPGLEPGPAGGTPAPEPGSGDELIICIDPGHGNPQIKGGQEKVAPNSEETKPALAYGATGTGSKTPEYVINMSVSLLLEDLLEKQGFKVIMTRRSDDENPGNIERAVIGNEAESDLVIRIHADGSVNQQANGVSVLYPGDKYISDCDLLTKSKSAAQFVHDAIIKATGAKPRGIVKRDDLTGFNWSTRPVILVEMGFLSNPDEDKRLNDPVYQDKIASGIVDGILQYFGH